jgi:hypothetical protein
VKPIFVAAIAGLLAMFAITARAFAWELVTPAEVARDRSAPRLPETLGLPRAGAPNITRGLPRVGVPSIVLDRPDISSSIRTPVSFRIRFVAASGTSIDVATFKAQYGWVALDITSRLLKHARLTSTGLSADDVDIPPGNHKVSLSVANNLGQVGEQVFEFTVK